MNRNVTDTELAVLKALWERGASTIRQLTDELYPEGSTAHYATVQKLLERLREKSCVSRQRMRSAWTFGPPAIAERESNVIGSPRSFVIVPPASRTRRMPAATSQG